MSEPAVTHGMLLDGRILYSQPRSGYRTAIEPILLAASVPAKPGDTVVEAGTGAGAGLLALTERVRRLTGVGIERDAEMAAIATANLAANGRTHCHVLVQDVLAWRPDTPFDHAFANPPWHDSAGTPSPLEGRRHAKIADTGLLERWAACLAASLRRRGTLSLILPASALAQGVSAMSAANCPEITVVPLWQRAQRPARLIILRGVKLGRGACTMAPGVALHTENGGYTEEAEKLLRANYSMAGITLCND